MTSTPVKDVGSVLNSLTSTVGNSTKTALDKGFQTVLNGQTDRSQDRKLPADSQSDKPQTAVKKTPGDSLKAKEAHRERVSEENPAEGKEALQDADEIPAEKLEEVMEVLGTAAADLMQQIVNTFEISPEELQSAMQELGMDSLDVLDQGKLGELLLKLGGAEDAYSLVTNGELYEDYQELMAGLGELLEDVSQDTGVSAEQLQEVIQQEPVTDEDPVEVPVELAAEAEDEIQKAPVEEKPAEANEVREVETPQAQQSVEEPLQSQSAEEDNRQSEPETGRRQSNADRTDDHHAFAQSFRTEQLLGRFEPQIQEAQTASQTSGTDTQDIMRQIMDYMRIQVRPDTTNLEMQLHPESLGSLHIQVASRAGMVTANFIAQNETVKAALESQMVQLRESFEQQGVKIEAIEVTVQSHAFERNLDQGRGQNGAQEQNQAAKRTRTRRINLNDSLEVDDLEGEDALTAEMMAASGSQVDYTA